MAKTYEYHEGKPAKEKFERGMKAVFQAPKDAPSPKKKARKKRAKKSSESGASRDSGASV